MPEENGVNVYVGRVPDPAPEDYKTARQQGAEAADQSVAQAPTDVLLRVAWAAGFGQTDQVQAAVDEARQQGATWRQIGEALGEPMRAVQSKYGGGRTRQAAYMRRQRAARRRGENQ